MDGFFLKHAIQNFLLLAYMFIPPHNTTTPSSGDLPINNVLYLTEHNNNSSPDSKVNKMHDLGFTLCIHHQ